MGKKRIPSDARMRVRTYDVLSRAVEEGVAYGWRRAHKHTDKPGDEIVIEQIQQAVMNEICEMFEFPDPE